MLRSQRPHRLSLTLPSAIAIVAAVCCISGGLGRDTSPPADGGTACAAAESLNRLSDFFARNADTFEADGYFGLSTAAIALNSAPLSSIASCGGGDSGLVEFRRTLARINRLLAGFRRRVAADYGGYNGVTYRRIDRPMEALFRRLLSPGEFRWRRLSSEAAPDGGGNSTGSDAGMPLAELRGLFAYNERLGDACFRSMLKVRRKRFSSKCPVSRACKGLFLTSRPSVGYGLTHQFTYWMIGIDKSCNLRLSDGRPVDKALIRDACRRAYAEHKRILRATMAPYLVDLALEQAVLCGVYGYRDFFPDSTVLLMRRQQDERLGCFGQTMSAKTGNTRAEPDRVGGRRLMHDAMLEGTCSSHTSGLAAAYFALSLRT